MQRQRLFPTQMESWSAYIFHLQEHFTQTSKLLLFHRSRLIADLIQTNLSCITQSILQREREKETSTNSITCSPSQLHVYVSWHKQQSPKESLIDQYLHLTFKDMPLVMLKRTSFWRKKQNWSINNKKILHPFYSISLQQPLKSIWRC